MAIHLIDMTTGEIDASAIAERANLRAASEYGSPDYPTLYLRQATEWATERARSERLAWRRDHGLPNDEPSTLMLVPSWGSSGDSFGAR